MNKCCIECETKICTECKTSFESTPCECGAWMNENDVPSLHPFKAAIFRYKELYDAGELNDIVSLDIANGNIQALFFKGSAQQLEALKKTLRIIRLAEEK